MPRIGWHASHEQIAPSRLLEDARLAERAGFDVGMSSDHFSPWSERQGESGFAWAWLGAALASTSLPFRIVNAPGQRYHPAVVAQAIATLAEMFPTRLWVCLGTGEASNEHITGDRWPAKSVRNARLLECVEIIRALLAGEEVSDALRIAHDQWRTNVFTPPVCWDLDSSDLQRHVAWILEAAELGFEEINLHHVGQEQRMFIEASGEHVLPAVR